MTTLLTVLRGLRSRALLSVTSLAMMVLAVSGAVLGPMFQQAATESYTLTRIDEAPESLTGLSWQAAPVRGAADLPALLAGARTAVDEVRPPQYEPPDVFVLTGAQTRADGAEVRFLSRDDVCSTLEVEGRCPEAAGEALVHVDDLQGRALGDPLDGGALGELTVVGTYTTPVDTEHWLFPTLLASRPATDTQPYRPAPYVVAQDAVATLAPRSWSVQLESRLVVPDRVDDRELDSLVEAIEAQQAESEPRSFEGGLFGSTSQANVLGSIVEEVRAQRSAARSALAPAVVSLVLVALAMILRLQIAAAELRGPELALAALRGVGTRRAWLLGLAEPWLLVLVSAPLGVLGGYAATSALAGAWLRDGTVLEVPRGSLLGAAGVAVALLAIAAAAVGRGMRQTLGARLTGVHRPRPSGRVVLLVELVVVLLAATLPLSVLGADRGGLGVADLLLPVAAAVAAGLLATRAVTALAIRWTQRGAERPLPAFVAARAVARRAQGTLVILPVCAAVAVSVFAVGVDSAAAAWRDSVAATTSPGAHVYASAGLLDETAHLTEELDPDRRYLMAVSQVVVPGSGTLVAVDSRRLGRAGDWPAQWLDGRSGAEAADLLAPAEPVRTLVGEGLSVATDSPSDGAELTVGLRTPAGLRTVTVGPVAAGRSTTEVDTASCAARCYLVSIALSRSDGPVTVTGIGTNAGPAEPALDEVEIAPDEKYLVPAAADPLPALVGVGEDGKLLTGTTLKTNSATLEVRPVGRAESLPLVGPAGLLVDLPTLTLQDDPSPALVTSFVVARADTPPDLRAALARAGLTEQDGAADTRRLLDGTAYAQALRLYLVVAAALLVMALGGLLVSNAVQLPARRRDAASLRVVGVPRRSLVAASLAESLVVLGSAAVAGLAAGIGSLAVLLPSLDLGVVDDLRTPRVLPDPDVGRLVLVSAGVALVLVVVAVLFSVAVVRRARAATLRETAG